MRRLRACSARDAARASVSVARSRSWPVGGVPSSSPSASRLLLRGLVLALKRPTRCDSHHGGGTTRREAGATASGSHGATPRQEAGDATTDDEVPRRAVGITECRRVRPGEALGGVAACSRAESVLLLVASPSTRAAVLRDDIRSAQSAMRSNSARRFSWGGASALNANLKANSILYLVLLTQTVVGWGVFVWCLWFVGVHCLRRARHQFIAGEKRRCRASHQRRRRTVA